MSAAREFWSRAVKQPQQLWLRKALFQMHLWCGLALAVYVVLIGVSGSILVFKDELMPRPRAAHLAFDARNCTAQNLIGSMKEAARNYPKLVLSLASCPIEANPFYAITLHPPELKVVASRSLTVYVHPETRKVVGQVDEAASWIGVVEGFHLDLLLKKNGRLWNGAGAAVLLLLAISGLTLWWPGIRNWRRGLKVDLRLSWRRINWDLHSAAGIWTVCFILAWAVTGIYFAWPSPFEKAIDSFSTIVTARYPDQEMRQIMNRPVEPSSGPLDLVHVLADAQALSPGNHLEGLFFGSGPNAVLTVYMARGHLGDYTRTDFLYFDQQTGKILYDWHRGQNRTLGDWVLWLFVPIHFGTSWGFAGKLVWCAFGLVLPLLAVSGFLMYWNRWLRKRLGPKPL